MRHLGIDLGEVRIGLATSDSMGICATGLETYKRVDMQKDLQYIANIVIEGNIKCVVMGLPVNMDGTNGERVEKAKEFAQLLKPLLPIDVKIDFQDERLSTVASERVLIEAGMRRDKRKKVIDKVASTIILQTYLDIH